MTTFLPFSEVPMKSGAGFLPAASAEIINADSRQFYRFMDIGTAKITPEEMHGIPHHLLSVLDPKEPCSIAWFQKEAARVIGEIHGRGNIPVLVGGSMLYVSAMVDGLKPLPSDPALRTRLSEEYDIDQGEALHRRLAQVDPQSAASIPRENKVYLLRALEIFEQTGKPKSVQKIEAVSPYDLLIFGMDVPREELNMRINDRTKLMMESGWIDEVRQLLDRGYSVDDPGMKSIGYREIVGYLQQSQQRFENRCGSRHNNEATFELPLQNAHSPHVKSLSDEIALKTRAYAKRHMTWWRRDARIRWIPIQK
ncbi:MAG: tRNA (adenosine(37)-N6)-dimethylallyltransferase MiaA [Candidatus Peribacteraceae bacterium]|nr:tRNA (adenosine(37)-N6)-dimethylallyltransferase MiaA [Candidatus Peribacteraceae bacterium]